MNERKSVGILMIVIFVFVFAYRVLQNELSENYLDFFVIAFFMALIFAWQYISPTHKNKRNE